MRRRSADAGGGRKLAFIVCALLCLGALPQNSAQARHLRFDERVKAQEAIERVYYSHQIAATLPFEVAVPRALLEKKVRTYLKQSVALEEFWNTPITTPALQRELERIAASTRFPERVEEIYRALGGDPVLILESFARPVLVQRMARSFFAFDQRIHAAARKEAEDLRHRLESGAVDVSAEHPDRQILELIRYESSSVVNGDSPSDATRHARYAAPGQPLELTSAEFERWRARAPRTVGEIGPLVEETDAFVVRVVLNETSEGARLAVYTIPKTSWEAWWLGIADGFDEASVRPVVGSLSQISDSTFSKSLESDVESGMPMAPDGVTATSPTCIPDDTWDNGILDDLPLPRYRHTAVWTGTLMIVWGGVGDVALQNTGARYDPLTDTWAAVSTINGPAARYLHTAMWTGTVMVIWGGAGGGNSFLATGGRYDPVLDFWEPTSTLGAPTGRYSHSAVWTGSEMIVWGGHGLSPGTGGRYNPATDTWIATSTMGAPSARDAHTAVWTGSRMIVWGGVDAVGNAALNTGGCYDPASDTWMPTSTSGVPTPRLGHTAVWTGSEMIVWGGFPEFTFDQNTGGRYDPTSDTWIPTSTIGAPSERSLHTAVWTGTEMTVWGGEIASFDFEQTLDSGARYDPASDSWLPTSMTNAPSRRASHTAIWTGSQMIVWGGRSDVSMGRIEAVFNTGGRYDPAVDSWTPTSVLDSPAGSHCCHTAVWTGNLMIVWGGRDEVSFPVNTGARYDLLADAWTPTSLSNAPAPRDSHQAVWTGSEMIVWGGARSDGGRYDPVSDAWRPISSAGAPSPRFLTTPAIWTGREMIVWGGLVTTTTATNTGGRYNPATDSWSTTSTTGAPSPRHFHTAAWTGSEMIIWGGSTPFVGVHNTGARYDPVMDAWRPTSLSGAPSGRQLHSAIWTGSLMIVWGGTTTGPTYLDTGGLYDPATDQWTATSTVNKPTGRHSHTAIWTGNKMIIWGGSGGGNTGGLYDPAVDSWTPTSTTNAPSYGGSGHTSAWTGDFMIVWGRNWGGRYALDQAVDNDSDGFNDCASDCDDTNPLVWSAPVEVAGLQVSGAIPTGLSWASQASLAGPGTQYDLASGGLLPSGGVEFSSAVCLQSGTATSHSDTRPGPVAGSGYWYLVRGRNTCAVGIFGTSLDDKSIGPCP